MRDNRAIIAAVGKKNAIDVLPVTFRPVEKAIVGRNSPVYLRS